MKTCHQMIQKHKYQLANLLQMFPIRPIYKKIITQLLVRVQFPELTFAICAYMVIWVLSTQVPIDLILMFLHIFNSRCLKTHC